MILSEKNGGFSCGVGNTFQLPRLYLSDLTRSISTSPRLIYLSVRPTSLSAISNDLFHEIRMLCQESLEY